jgi:exodeoxyribonuclease III
LRITTFNVNSIRLRLELLARVVAALRPDVLCLQEIKIEDRRFPAEAMRELGFSHLHVHGQKAYHGVAVLSRLPLEEPRSHHWCGIDHARHAAVELPGGIELHNLYVPAGGDVPDRERNPKFGHKLDMLAELAAWFGGQRRPNGKAILLGDLNIAPLETDVWSHKQLLDVVSHTPVEVEAALQLVVLPGARLGRLRPRPAPRPRLAVAGPGTRPARCGRAARGARLGAAVGPCPRHRRSRAVSWLWRSRRERRRHFSRDAGPARLLGDRQRGRNNAPAQGERVPGREDRLDFAKRGQLPWDGST